MTPHLGDLSLGRLLCGLASAEEAQAIEAHARGCPACAAELQAARAAGQRFERFVFPRTLAAVEARASRSRWRLRWPWVLSLCAAAGLALLAVLPQREPELGVKGGVALRIFARRSGQTFQVRDGAALLPGDVLRFELASAEQRCAVASVDGRGAANVYYPSTLLSTLAPAAAATAAAVVLPGAIELDDAAGPERVFAVCSSAPLPSAELDEALRALGRGGPSEIRRARALSLPGRATSQATLLFEKGATP
jgi:hypothetical protein